MSGRGPIRRASVRRPRAVRTGLDNLLARVSLLRGLRIGLITNPTALTADLVPAADALRRARGVRLKSLFGPEHGVWADAQDRVELEDSRDPLTGLPVYSLYGKTRKPTPTMLGGIDAVVFDVQDVGARYDTFIYTMLHAMEACAAHGKALIVLDRPNPLGGDALDGNVLEPEYLSFVGLHPLAARHGMTVGELALMFRAERCLDVDLRVVRMRGWERWMSYEDTGLPWIMPSPNMPTLDTVYVYPGACLVEGTNLSEGRGTTRPFEMVGAPWLDPWALARDMRRERLAGVHFRPATFEPTFQKHAKTPCGGCQIHVTDRSAFRPVAVGAALLREFYGSAPTQFAWRQPPYEYEHDKLPIDILAGSPALRGHIEAQTPLRDVVASWKSGEDGFRALRSRFLLY